MVALNTTLLDTAMKETTQGFFRRKKLPEGPALYFVPQTLFRLVTQNF